MSISLINRKSGNKYAFSLANNSIAHKQNLLCARKIYSCACRAAHISTPSDRRGTFCLRPVVHRSMVHSTGDMNLQLNYVLPGKHFASMAKIYLSVCVGIPPFLPAGDKVIAQTMLMSKSIGTLSHTDVPLRPRAKKSAFPPPRLVL